MIYDLFKKSHNWLLRFNVNGTGKKRKGFEFFFNGYVKQARRLYVSIITLSLVPSLSVAGPFPCKAINKLQWKAAKA